jgi:hypothetical protein
MSNKNKRMLTTFAHRAILNSLSHIQPDSSTLLYIA